MSLPDFYQHNILIQYLLTGYFFYILQKNKGIMEILNEIVLWNHAGLLFLFEKVTAEVTVIILIENLIILLRWSQNIDFNYNGMIQK